MDRADLIRMTGGTPEGPNLDGITEEQLISSVEEHIDKNSLLSLPPGFVRNFYYSLKTQRFVVLAGRPGTGKTQFARAFRAALEELFPESVTEVVVSVGEDYGESDIVGYEKIAGGLAATELTRELFLAKRPRDVYVVVLDEMNLSQVDAYLSRLLPAIESDVPVELPGMEVPFNLPPDSYFVGTVNSYVEEPTRVPLSGPVKRRSNIIEMPNVLSMIVEDNDREAFADLVKRLLEQTLERYKTKERQGLSSILDHFRISDLNEAAQDGSLILENACLDLLWEMVSVCARSTQTSLTAGVLQDVIDYAALSSWEHTFDALDRQIAQKVVPQLAGPEEVARGLIELLQANATSAASFGNSLAALKELVQTADPSSRTTYFKY